jgi:hypothetical protein
MTSPRPATDPITLRLDRWASLLRNCDNLELSDAEIEDLSTLLTAAANEISQLGAASDGWIKGDGTGHVLPPFDPHHERQDQIDARPLGPFGDRYGTR